MQIIEKYAIEESGYHPLLIREGWQVAKLNYIVTQNVENIDKLDLHNHTDEVFILLKGRAVLVGATIEENHSEFIVELMQPGIVYNIPQKTWHNISIEDGCEVLIIEKSNTHLSDVEFFYLSVSKKDELCIKLRNAFVVNS
jgi:mannose-6-phosphate isomerase-like protein (cupin superfamily)